MSDHADAQSLEKPVPVGPANPISAGQPQASPLAAEDFSAVLHRVEDASRAWDIQPDLAEGRFVSAMMAAIGWSGRVTQSAQAEWRVLFKSERDAAEMELARAREITKAVSAALGQARSALLGLQVERENVAVRMMHETMPLFVDKLKAVLVVREKGLADALRIRVLMMAAVGTLGVFVSGYGLRYWIDSDAVAALGNCLAHAVEAQGHVYCDVTSFRDARR